MPRMQTWLSDQDYRFLRDLRQALPLLRVLNCKAGDMPISKAGEVLRAIVVKTTAFLSMTVALLIKQNQTQPKIDVTGYSSV